ncbi:MAG: diacylglycerol kinase family lipid kinase [Gemmatimonadetes bacterium]|nr:diacylglycerol kinase family lipid kinase [Gemmatimonadota bacterium]
MPRVLLITNPAAARTSPEVAVTVCRVLEGAGWVVDVAPTTGPGDAGRLAAQGVADRVDAIAVYGGDGTTMQATNGMIGSGIPLALIPGGTGNLLARNLRLPLDPVKAASMVVRGERRRIDLGAADRPEGVRHFAVASGAGFDAEIMAHTSDAAKRRWGPLAYVAGTYRALERLRPVPHRVTVDGKALELEAATVVVANCGSVGSLYFTLGRGIAPDDGWLDVVALKAGGLLEGVAAMWEMNAGRDGRGRVVRARGRDITVESETVRPVQMDGELAGTTPFRVRVRAGAIEVLVKSGKGR